MANPLPQRTNRCFGRRFNSSLSPRFANLGVTGPGRNSHTHHTNTKQVQIVASTRNQSNKPVKLHQKQRPLRSNTHEIIFNSRIASPTPFQPRKNITAACGSAGSAFGPELDWMSSINCGDSEISIQVTLGLSIAPKSSSKQKTGNFALDVTRNHNNEVPSYYPRMRSRELDDTEDPLFWEIISFEREIDPPKLESPCKLSLLKNETRVYMDRSKRLLTLNSHR